MASFSSIVILQTGSVTIFPSHHMLLILKNLKSYLRSLILSFWLVQNLSLLTEGFPTSGNDNHINNIHKEILKNISITLNFVSESVLQRFSQNMHITQNQR